MKPEQIRDKIDLLQEQRDQNARVSEFLARSIAFMQSRFNYSKREALAAMRAYSQSHSEVRAEAENTRRRTRSISSSEARA